VAILAAWAAAQQPTPTGPAVGSRVPAFEAPDQSGQQQSLKTIAGPKGAMLVFVRSADW
jgi:peroxiredoxin